MKPLNSLHNRPSGPLHQFFFPDDHQTTYLPTASYQIPNKSHDDLSLSSSGSSHLTCLSLSPSLALTFPSPVTSPR